MGTNSSELTGLLKQAWQIGDTKHSPFGDMKLWAKIVSEREREREREMWRRRRRRRRESVMDTLDFT